MTYPKGGEKIEVGNTYKITWQNNSGQIPKTISLHLTSQDGTDYGYKNIITSNIPATNNGSMDWTVDVSFDPKYIYELVIFGDKREILGRSNSTFSIVDNRPLSFTIAGGKDIIIDKNNLFTFGKQLTLTNNQNQTGRAIIYSSGDTLQKVFAQVSLANFSTDACRVLGATDGGPCDVKGEQAVTLDFTGVLSDSSSSWITKRKISLSSKTVKSVRLERTKSNYEIDLVSMDLSKGEAIIIVRPI